MTGENWVQERALTSVRPHARRLLFPSLALVIVVGAGSFGYFFLDEWGQRFVALGGAIVALLVLWMLPLLSWLSTQYLITTRRIVVRRGLFVRTRQEVLLSRSYDVSVRQAGLQRAFRSGDLLINIGLDRPIVLRDVPRAELVQRALSDVMEASTASIATVRRPAEAADQVTRRSRVSR